MNDKKIVQHKEIHLALEHLKGRKVITSFDIMKQRIQSLVLNSFSRRELISEGKVPNILCCNYEQFKEHIEKQFLPWMNWDNYGKYNGELNFGWDFDHIIPITSANTTEDIILLNHYTNIQPLCSYTNRFIKKDKLDFNNL